MISAFVNSARFLKIPCHCFFTSSEILVLALMLWKNEGTLAITTILDKSW